MNEVQGIVKVYLLGETEFDLNEFVKKLHHSNVIDSKLVLTISDGTVHELQVCEYLEAIIKSFTVNGEETINEEIDQKENVAKVIPLATRKVI
jgi:hypothetical protein